jgi:hypothetical protein
MLVAFIACYPLVSAAARIDGIGSDGSYLTGRDPAPQFAVAAKRLS